jgi:hypothetical protein
LTLAGSTGTIAWQKSTNWTTATPTWTTVTGTTATLATGALTVSTAYRAVLTLGTCTSVNTSNYVITVGPVTKSISQNTTTPSGVDATNALCISSTSKILTLATGYVGSIQWQRSVNAGSTWTDITGATSATYTVSGSSVGANMFRVKLTNGTCTAAYSTNTLTIYYKSCVVLKNMEESEDQQGVDAFIYPNPFTDNFAINLSGKYDDLVSVSIYDMSGKILENHAVLTDELESLKVGSELSGGIYNVVITSGNQIIQKKVVKE